MDGNTCPLCGWRICSCDLEPLETVPFDPDKARARAATWAYNDGEEPTPRRST